ncbi:MAG: preprotein translocase subunit SecG [Clostridia bacterium]
MNAIKLTITIVQVVLSLFLIATILLQPSKHTGLSGAISGAADTFMSKNKAKTWDVRLAKITTVVAFLFVILTLTLYIL